jgi:hypothetical protein
MRRWTYGLLRLLLMRMYASYHFFFFVLLQLCRRSRVAGPAAPQKIAFQVLMVGFADHEHLKRRDHWRASPSRPPDTAVSVKVTCSGGSGAAAPDYSKRKEGVEGDALRTTAPESNYRTIRQQPKERRSKEWNYVGRSRW